MQAKGCLQRCIVGNDLAMMKVDQVAKVCHIKPVMKNRRVRDLPGESGVDQLRRRLIQGRPFETASRLTEGERTHY
jgi:hypothetical protein